MTKTLFCVYQSFSRTFPANFLSSAHRTLGLSPSDHPGTLDFLLKKGHLTACRLILTFHFKLTHKPFRIFTARLFSHLIRRASLWKLHCEKFPPSFLPWCIMGHWVIHGGICGHGRRWPLACLLHSCVSAKENLSCPSFHLICDSLRPFSTNVSNLRM